MIMLSYTDIIAIIYVCIIVQGPVQGALYEKQFACTFSYIALGTILRPHSLDTPKMIYARRLNNELWLVYHFHVIG